jgi:hypothetical protein
MFTCIDTNKNGILEKQELHAFFCNGSKGHGATFDNEEFERSWKLLSQDSTIEVDL